MSRNQARRSICAIKAERRVLEGEPSVVHRWVDSRGKLKDGP